MTIQNLNTVPTCYFLISYTFKTDFQEIEVCDEFELQDFNTYDLLFTFF